MKVHIGFTVEVKADDWSGVFGVDLGAVNADVKRYAEYIVTEKFRELGMLVYNGTDPYAGNDGS